MHFIASVVYIDNKQVAQKEKKKNRYPHMYSTQKVGSIKYIIISQKESRN